MKSELISKTEFSKLAINMTASSVFSEGAYIGVRHYYQQYINLYLYNDFFVEVWYLPVENSIQKIELLKDLKTLNLYIDYMNDLDKD